MRFLPAMEPTERAEAIASVASVFMAAGMITVAAVSGSVSVLAEGIDTVVDIVASVAVMIGLRLSRRHSRDFPDGLYKVENIVGLAIGVLVLFSAYELTGEAIGGLTGHQEPISAPWVAIGTMSVVVVITGLLAWNKGRVGKAENSPSLVADSRHSWTDAIASAGVVLGVALAAAGVPYADSIMALVIVAILFWSGGQVVLDALKVLLDASIEPDLLQAAAAAAGSDPRVRRVVRVDGRNSGSYRFLHLAVVPESEDLRDAEQAAQTIKDSVREAVTNVESVQVEFVPDPSRDIRVAVPLEADSCTIAPDLASASSYAVLAVAPGWRALEQVSLVPSPRGPDEAPDGAGRDIASVVALARLGVDQILVTGSSPTGGPAFVMDANAMEVLERPDLTTLDQVQAQASAGSLLDGQVAQSSSSRSDPG